MKKATIYNFSRLCSAQKNKCENCPMSADNNGADKLCLTLVTKYPDKANEIILKWCEEHPIKTRQSELLKCYPYIPIIGETVDICPKRFDMDFLSSGKCKEYAGCEKCRKEYWLEEVDENE